jgi:hypothetical protein
MAVIHVQERDGTGWGLPKKAVHKLYRTLYEGPRRKQIASRLFALPPSPPVDPLTPFTVHMLVCRRDVVMAACTARAANLAFGTALPWVFHDDGSLRDEDEAVFQAQLPGSKVVRRPEADRVARERLAAYPEILKYRQHQIMALKLVDVRVWGRGARLAYIDSDVLFFRRPDFILEALRGERPKNYFNKDIADAYVRPAGDIAREVGVRPFDRLNAGLWVLHEEVIDLDTIEGWLKHPAFARHLYDYTLDQTFISMLASSSAHGVEHLPAAYDVAFRKEVGTSVNKHYIGRIRHGYELEGVSYLLEACDFERRWQAFAAERSARPVLQQA